MLNDIQKLIDEGLEAIAVRGKRPVEPWSQPRPWTPARLHQRFVVQRCEVAVVTGMRSGIVVADCDTEKAADYVVNNFGPTGKVIATPRGGKHFYYRWPGIEVRNWANAFGIGLDGRGDGGYAKTFPSPGYHILKSEELTVFDPAWLGPLKKARYEREDMSDFDRVRRAIAYADKVPGAVSGQGGHNATMRMAGLLIQKFGLTIEQAYPIFEMWNRTCLPPWSGKELMHKLASAEERL